MLCRPGATSDNLFPAAVCLSRSVSTRNRDLAHAQETQLGRDAQRFPGLQKVARMVHARYSDDSRGADTFPAA